jgi:hypothetical protein
MQQQQAVIMFDETQKNEQTNTAATALPTTKLKRNHAALTVANFLLGDSSSDEETRS